MRRSYGGNLCHLQVELKAAQRHESEFESDRRSRKQHSREGNRCTSIRIIGLGLGLGSGLGLGLGLW